jgi:hypothetical protein
MLANKLFEMAVALRFKIPTMDIFKGRYAPKGWEHRDSRQFEAMEFIYELSKGTKIVPNWICGVTQQPPSGPLVAEPSRLPESNERPRG